jgi:hypothetical protein
MSDLLVSLTRLSSIISHETAVLRGLHCLLSDKYGFVVVIDCWAIVEAKMVDQASQPHLGSQNRHVYPYQRQLLEHTY